MIMAKILLIEDDASIRELYQRALVGAGYDVVTAIDGETGLTALAERPDVVLLDVMLPVMNGTEVLKRIRAVPENKGLPVILLTNLEGSKIRERAAELGATDYVVKIDISPLQLIQLVQDALK